MRQMKQAACNLAGGVVRFFMSAAVRHVEKRGGRTMKRTKYPEKQEKNDLWESLGAHGRKPDESTLHHLLENKVSKNT